MWPFSLCSFSGLLCLANLNIVFWLLTSHLHPSPYSVAQVFAFISHQTCTSSFQCVAIMLGRALPWRQLAAFLQSCNVCKSFDNRLTDWGWCLFWWGNNERLFHQLYLLLCLISPLSKDCLYAYYFYHIAPEELAFLQDKHFWEF